jgi:hypothetical protein
MDDRRAVDQPSILHRLCQYYLRCIAYDALEIGAYVTSKYAATPVQLDYVAVPYLPGSREFERARRQPPVANWLQRHAIDKKTVFFGYPIFVEETKTGAKLWPILLLSFDLQTGDAEDLPSLNFGALKALPPSADGGTTTDEAIDLLEKLGLTAPPEQLPDFRALVARLPSARPEWPWQEDLTPDALNGDGAMCRLATGGVYNCAALFAADRPRFTAGLETELKHLSEVAIGQVTETALGHWLNGLQGRSRAAATAPDFILEPMPLNTEQRQAVSTALKEPLTVITGPPGTGKSQLVSALVVNAVRRGETVLLASRNNKAVDVVEARVNGLAARPAVFRFGDAVHLEAVSASIDQMLAAAIDSGDNANINAAERRHHQIMLRLDDLDRELDEIIQRRNDVCVLAERCEPLRERIGDERFRILKEAPIADWRARVESAQRLLAEARRDAQSVLVRCVWPLVGSKRIRRAGLAFAGAVDIVDVLALPVPAPTLDDGNLAECQRVIAQVSARFGEIEAGIAYWRSLRALDEDRTPPDVDRLRMQAIADLAANSRRLWELSPPPASPLRREYRLPTSTRH